VRELKLEAGAVHRTVKDPWRDQAVLGKARDEGLGVPPLTVCRQTVSGQRVAEGGMIDQARADGGTSRWS